MRKIVFYTEAKKNGGHELLALRIIGEFTKQYDVYVICSEKNLPFISYLKGLDKVSILTIPFFTRRFQGILSFFELYSIYYLRKVFKELRPEIVISLQGNIEFGSRILLMKYLFKNDFILVSYIPLTFEFRSLASNGLVRFLVGLKDRFNDFYFKVPDRFVVINERSFNELKHKGLHNVHKIENGIDFYTKVRREESLYLKPKGRFSIAIIGRIDFKHKGQDKILKLMDIYGEVLKDVDFLIIGDGKDLTRFKVLASTKYYSEQIIFFGWLGIERYFDLIPEIDIVAIPSNYEGLPLVLLESFFYKRTVIGSRIPGIMECLDERFTFEKDDIDGLFYAIEQNKKCDKSTVDRNHELVLQNHSMDRYLLDWKLYVDNLR